MSLNVQGVTATLKMDDGSRVTFTQANGTGAWSAPARSDSTLAANGDGTWTVVCHATDTYVFDVTGRLIAKRDPNGYTTSISYPSGQTVVTDPASRTLTFVFNGTHVTSVTDSGFAGSVVDIHLQRLGGADRRHRRGRRSLGIHL